ncbi:carbohydrate esterase family 4 protein [Mucidula mucida]|nr:carbohydrate esterase family 4 protein [Mucidula mucida]
MFFSLLLVVNAALAGAVVLPRHDDHEHVMRKRVLPGKWFHDDDHPVHKLFGRAPPGDGTDYPDWTNSFPAAMPSGNDMPQAWKDALADAVAAGKIPDIPQSTTASGTNPTYPTGFDPTGPVVCSSTYKCRAEDDVWDAPEGQIGISFDDGPSQGTTKLLDFLDAENITATHFLIGIYIRNTPDAFTRIYEQGGDIAVHTYTHPYMTGLSNADVVAQLGWTMEIIRNSTGGRIPKFWRPPYGDSDNRVRAIASEVLGLTTVIWNQDTEDWSMATGGTTMDAINASMTQWLTGPKSPGLVILEHELTEDTVQAFMNAYPVMKSNGWEIESLALIESDSAYQNSDGTGDDSTVQFGDILGDFSTSTSASSTTSARYVNRQIFFS